MFPLMGWSQEVSNVRFEQVGKEIHIYYDLIGDATYQVQLFCSEDDGTTWGNPLVYITGDVGDHQTAGINKTIVWDVLKERDALLSSVQFKVVAEGFEQIEGIESEPGFVFKGKSGVFIDERDGQEYNWVRIGDQVWMAENLNVGRMEHIEHMQANNGIIEKYCIDNDASNCMIYGGLYQWGEMIQYDGSGYSKGICPEGWHIPSRTEWGKLILNVDFELQSDPKQLQKQKKSQGSYVGVNASINLKSKTEWIKEPGMNSSGFNALPSGKINHSPTRFEGVGKKAFFWTSTNMSKKEGWVRLINSNPKVLNVPGFKKEAFSVRCIRD